MPLLRNMGYRAAAYLGPKLTEKRIIWELKHPERLPSPDIRAQRFTADNPPPRPLRNHLPYYFGFDYQETLDLRLSQGARLYFLLHNGDFAALGWAKSGRDFTYPWLVGLEPDDWVNYGAYVNPALRGRGLRGKLIAATYGWERGPGRCLADTHVNNYPSMKQLSRIGFEKITEAYPTRH